MYKGNDLKNSFSCVADETQQSIFDSFQSFGSLNDHTIEESFGMELEATYADKEETLHVDHCFSSTEESHAEINTDELVPEQTFVSRAQSPAESSVVSAENDLSRSQDEDEGLDKSGGKPKRPLSAYNLYFQLERERLIDGTADTEFTAEEVERVAAARRNVGDCDDKPKRKHRKSHGKISFAELARTIANKWKTLQPSQKDLLLERAAMEKARYLRELEEWTKNRNAELVNPMFSSCFKSTGKESEFMKEGHFPAIVTPSPPRRSLVDMMSAGYGFSQFNAPVNMNDGQVILENERMMNFQRQYIAREILAMDNMLPQSPNDVRFNSIDPVQMSGNCEFGNYSGMNNTFSNCNMYDGMPFGNEPTGFMATSGKQSLSFDYSPCRSMSQDSQYLDECHPQVSSMYQGQQQQYLLDQGPAIQRRFTFPTSHRTCRPMSMNYQQNELTFARQQTLYTPQGENMMSSIAAGYDDDFVQ